MLRDRVTRGPLTAIARRARTLQEAGAVALAQWSFAQICQHVALSIEATLINSTITIGEEIDSPPIRRYGTPRRWLFRSIILTFGYIPGGVAVPQGAEPGAQATLDAELTHLESAARAFEAAALDEGRVWPGQLFMGPLTAAQWRRFHHVHAAHHFAHLAVRGRPAR